MNAPEPLRLDWTAANQRLLVAEFARLKARLRGGDDSAERAEVTHARDSMPYPAAIDQIVERFGLSGFERDLLLLTGGVEMDSELAGLCAQASANGQRPWASFGLALAALPDPHWSATSPMGPLRQWRLIDLADETSPTSGRLRIEERVLSFLAGINFLEPRLQPLLRAVKVADVVAPSQRATANAIGRILETSGSPLPIISLQGNDPNGQRDVAALVASRLGLGLMAIRCDDLPTAAMEQDALARLWMRESALLDAALLIECDDVEPPPTVARMAERLVGITFIASKSALPLDRAQRRYTVDKPSPEEQRALWQQALGRDADALGEHLDAVAAELRLSAHEIRRVSNELSDSGGAASLSGSALWQACRATQRRELGALAQRIEPMAGWNDLVLPEAQKATLRQIASHLRHRTTVYQQWGFASKGSRGLGLSALFAGESGTGKTMAAEVLANELHLDLYRIDLSAVISKYIGETEKNLARVFDAADDSGVILLFDEADALFGKRSEVKDSHDRYANIEVSYLLQRMEAYRGLAILTTNQKAALDTAFHRRLRFVVQFPFPEVTEREAIWRGVFPAQAPTAGLDFVRLARLQVAGGNIRNIALNAAFLAAEDGRPVDMMHLLRAAQVDAIKRDRPLSEAETRGMA